MAFLVALAGVSWRFLETFWPPIVMFCCGFLRFFARSLAKIGSNPRFSRQKVRERFFCETYGWA
jgi:hypothetical protein